MHADEDVRVVARLRVEERGGEEGRIGKTKEGRENTTIKQNQ